MTLQFTNYRKCQNFINKCQNFSISKRSIFLKLFLRKYHTFVIWWIYKLFIEIIVITNLNFCILHELNLYIELKYTAFKKNNFFLNSLRYFIAWCTNILYLISQSKGKSWKILKKKTYFFSEDYKMYQLRYFYNNRSHTYRAKAFRSRL